MCPYCSSFALMQIVQRAKKCLDFGATLYVFHLLAITIYTFSFPTSTTFWVVTLISAAIAIILGETLCMKKEMAEIPIGFLSVPQDANRSPNDASRASLSSVNESNVFRDRSSSPSFRGSIDANGNGTGLLSGITHSLNGTASDTEGIELGEARRDPNGNSNVKMNIGLSLSRPGSVSKQKQDPLSSSSDHSLPRSHDTDEYASGSESGDIHDHITLINPQPLRLQPLAAVPSVPSASSRMLSVSSDPNNPSLRNQLAFSLGSGSASGNSSSSRAGGSGGSSTTSIGLLGHGSGPSGGIGSGIARPVSQGSGGENYNLSGD